MPTWIVLRHSSPEDAATAEAAVVVGSVRAASETDARIVAHSRWMNQPHTRIELCLFDSASPLQRYAASLTHIDVDADQLRLEAIFEDRLFL